MKTTYIFYHARALVSKPTTGNKVNAFFWTQLTNDFQNPNLLELLVLLFGSTLKKTAYWILSWKTWTLSISIVSVVIIKNQILDAIN